MEKKSSYFGVNLFLQLLIGYFLAGFVPYYFGTDRILGAPIAAVALIFQTSFWFGLIYGIFRLAGVKSRPLEFYYQNFPLGWHRGKSSAAEKPATSAAADLGGIFNWDELFSAHYLRHAGMLLILSSIFALLFRVEWSLAHKIIAAIVVAVLGLGSAEYFKSKSRVISSTGFLIGFAALQFGLTLGGRWLVDMHGHDAATLSTNLLLLKSILSLGVVPLLFRYGTGFSAVPFFGVFYLAPASLTYSGFPLEFKAQLVFVLFASFVTLCCAMKIRSAGLALLNSIAANLLIVIMHFSQITFLSGKYIFSDHYAEFCLVAVVGIYLLHLLTTVFLELAGSAADAAANDSSRMLHTALTHTFLLLALGGLLDLVPGLAGQFGPTVLVLSLFPLGGHLWVQSKSGTENSHSGLLQMSVVMSGLGLFLQANGPWTAVVFLAYGCGILWYSLVRGNRALKLFAFVVLTASLFKLYTQCRELFDSVSGTGVLFVIGLVLVALAGKMEKSRRA